MTGRFARLVHDKIYYLLELTRGRYDYPELRELAIALAQQYQPDVVLIEDTCAGTAPAQELHNLVKKPIKPVAVHGNKVFNSLDAQREACAAFILSQKHEGWAVLPTLYDDGGFSGGTMERPALQRRVSRSIL
jgi:phage terminase large subunit-like protein